MEIHDKVAETRTREALGAFIRDLRKDLLENDSDWENPTLERFLEALAAWVDDAPGYFADNETDESSMTKWELFANMLLAASMYE